MSHHLRHHGHLESESTFGSDRFGVLAERIACFFGTAGYIIGQTVIVILWILVNAFFLVHGFDPYPFILLNLAFSTQAAYAAPLILLAQTRQAERDKRSTEADARHREEIAQTHTELLRSNTEITEQVARLTEELHSRLIQAGKE